MSARWPDTTAGVLLGTGLLVAILLHATPYPLGPTPRATSAKTGPRGGHHRPHNQRRTVDTTTLLTNDEMSRVLVTVRDNNPSMSESLGRRIVGEAAKFVAAGAQYDVPMAPSRVVDEGWHALILHTALYAGLCRRFGRFVHHHPGYNPMNYDPKILDRTRAVIERAGYNVDPDLWTAPTDDGITVAANCQHAPECAIRPMPRPENPVTAATGA